MVLMQTGFTKFLPCSSFAMDAISCEDFVYLSRDIVIQASHLKHANTHTNMQRATTSHAAPLPIHNHSLIAVRRMFGAPLLVSYRVSVRNLFRLAVFWSFSGRLGGDAHLCVSRVTLAVFCWVRV
jgi:hypothetical protein